MFKILLLAFVACVSATDFRKMFGEAMNKYRVKDGLLKTEPPAVRQARYESFVKFAKLTEAINANKELTFQSTNNFLSILTEEERHGHLGLNITGRLSTVISDERPALTTNLKVAKSRDFSKKISAVKDQGGCGSCWTFAATAALEGEIYFTTGTEDVSLSEQEYMECSTNSDGCQGGWMEDCYTYSVRDGRIAPTKAYPYTETDARYCQARGKANALDDTNTRITGNIPIKGGDSALLQYADKHIVSVAIAVVNSFYGYTDGVYNEKNCRQLNHAVAVVGFGSDYWYVRNSWGQGWGDEGYLKMSRNINNICGISSEAHIPRVECADNTCKSPDIDDGGDDEEEEEDEESTDESDDGSDDESDGDNGNKICPYESKLSPCKKSADAAQAICDEENIPKAHCIIAKVKKCFYASVGGKATGRFAINYWGPCEDGDGDDKDDDEDDNDDDNGGCNADAGLVFCNDCKCCKHKHMCHD